MNQTARPPRTNRDGDPCPPWCTADHDAGRGVHSGTVASFQVPGAGAPVPDDIRARVVQLPMVGEPPVVAVGGTRYGGQPGEDPALWLPVSAVYADAGDLAGLIEMLAAATPEQHRELAAAIRKAAADITETGDA